MVNILQTDDYFKCINSKEMFEFPMKFHWKISPGCDWWWDGTFLGSGLALNKQQATTLHKQSPNICHQASI